MQPLSFIDFVMSSVDIQAYFPLVKEGTARFNIVSSYGA